jgi:phage tail sheath protein FI
VLDTIITNTTTRGDSILPIDIVAYGSTTAEAITQAGLLNTNYAAAYWPWLLVKDEDTSANVWCTSFNNNPFSICL